MRKGIRAGLITTLVAFALALQAIGAFAAEIHTDMWVYQDGDTVTVNGSGFGSNEVVDFTATDPNDAVVDQGTATSDDAGDVVYQFVLHVTVSGIYTETAVGRTSGLSAATEFDPGEQVRPFSSSCTTPTSSFATGSTICAKATGLGANFSGTIEWWAPGAGSATYTAAVVENNGNATDVRALASPCGTWTLKLYEGSTFKDDDTFSLTGCAPPDTTAPTVTIDSVSDVLLNASETSTDVTWHANENGSYSVRVGGTTCSDGTEVASGTYSTSPATVVTNVLASSLAEGANTIRVCVTDGASNTGSATTTVTKDTLAPAVSTPNLATASDTGSSSSDDLTSDSTPTIDGTAEDGASVRLYREGSLIATLTATGGVWSFTEGTLAAGTYSYTADATDAAGNTSALSSALAVTIDTLAPAVSTPNLATASDTGSSSSDDLTSDSTPTIDGTAEDGASVRLYREGSLIATLTATGGVWSFTEGTLAAGTYSYTADATDAAGNTSALSSALAVTIDTGASVSAPDLTVGSDSGSSNSDNLTNDSTPTFTGTADPDSAISLRRGGVEVATGTANGAGVWTITDGTGPADGTYTYTAVATDPAGNESSESAGLSVTIDTLAPAVSPPDLNAGSDSGSSSTDNLTKDTTPTFDGTAEADSTVELFRGVASVGTTTATGGVWTITEPGAVADNTYSYTTKATDAAGNTSAASAPLSVTIDTLAPAVSAPDLNAGSDTGSSSTDNLTKDTTPTFDGTAEADSTVELFRGVASVGTTTATGGVWTITEPPDVAEGTYSYTTTATDAAGNTSAAAGPLSVTIDVTPPAVSPPDLNAGSDSGSSSTDNLTKDTTPTFDGTAEADSTVELFRGVASVGTTTATGGVWTITEPGAVADNTYSYTTKATDAAGNTSAASAPLSVTIDTGAPAVSTPDLLAGSDSGSSSTDNLTNDTTPTFTGTAEAGSAVSLLRDGIEVASGTADGAGAWTLTDNTGFSSDGPYAYTSIATDAAGNVSAASSALLVTIDTAAPDTLITAGPAEGSSTNTLPVSFSFVASPSAGDTFECKIDLVAFAACSSPKAYSTLTLGAHTFQVRASDAAGNVDPTPAARNWEHHAITSLLYNGQQYLSAGGPLQVAAKLSSAASDCVGPGLTIWFYLETDPVTGAAVADPGYLLGSATTDSSGQATLTIPGSVTSSWIEGPLVITAVYLGTVKCDPAYYEGSIVVTLPGAAATGGGHYTLSGMGRINFGFTVRQVTPPTNPVTYKGQLLIINNTKWRLKGVLTWYSKSGSSTAGSASGVGNLSWWDWSLNGGLGDWVLAGSNLSFTIEFSDVGSGKKGSDTMGLKVVSYSLNNSPPEPLSLPTSSPQIVRTGNVSVS
jgi:DNA-binding transcriptional regulator YdaS (Cro superfamily)